MAQNNWQKSDTWWRVFTGHWVVKVNQYLQHVINQDFPDSQRGTVYDFLKMYGEKNYQLGHDRVHLAALKLANGDLEKLERVINAARSDYRDILAWAESPNEMERMFKKNNMSRKEAMEADKKQMKDWLTAHGLAIKYGGLDRSLAYLK